MKRSKLPQVHSINTCTMLQSKIIKKLFQLALKPAKTLYFEDFWIFNV